MSTVRAIYKYPIPIQQGFRLSLPAGSQILSAQMQRDAPCLWALITPGAEEEEREFRIIGTGWTIMDDPRSLRYIASLQERGLVWHLFEFVKIGETE